MRAVFDTLAEHLLATQRPGEDWTAYFSGGDTLTAFLASRLSV